MPPDKVIMAHARAEACTVGLCMDPWELALLSWGQELNQSPCLKGVADYTESYVTFCSFYFFGVLITITSLVTGIVTSRYESPMSDSADFAIHINYSTTSKALLFLNRYRTQPLTDQQSGHIAGHVRRARSAMDREMRRGTYR